MPDVSTGEEQVQVPHPSSVLLTVSTASVTFCSISFVLLYKVEKSDRQIDNNTTFCKKHLELFLGSDT